MLAWVNSSSFSNLNWFCCFEEIANLLLSHILKMNYELTKVILNIFIGIYSG